MEEDQLLKDQTDHPNGTTAKYTAVREDQRPDLKKKNGSSSQQAAATKQG